MDRGLNEVYPGLREIKNDQVRIIYRPIGNNKYVIVGIFLKKRDMDKKSLDISLIEEEKSEPDTTSKELKKTGQTIKGIGKTVGNWLNEFFKDDVN